MENITAQDMMIWVHTTQYEGPVGVTAKFYVKEEQVARFCEVMTSMVEHTRKEKGNRVYKLQADFKDSTIFWLLEDWESVSDLKSHCMTEIFQKNGEMMGSLLRDPAYLIGLYKSLD